MFSFQHRNVLNVALYEYRGDFPGHTHHSNSKQNTGLYQRTVPEVMDNVRSQVEHKVKPRQVYTHEISKLDDHDDFDAPRDTKQVRNIKYASDKQDRGEKANQNFSDQIMHMTSLVSQGDDFIRSIIHESGKVPSILLYTSKQIDMIEQACCASSTRTVLGVDRTFNLGDVYVTATSFKHPGLLRRITNESPIIIGPMLLHGSCSYDIYCHLFSKFAALFSEVNVSKLIIGSDDEHALRKAIRKVLPNSSNVICTRHIRNNISRYLQDTVGLNEHGRQQVLTYIFGRQGVITMSNLDDYDDKMEELKGLVTRLSGNTRFNKYVDTTVAEALRDGVIKPCLRGEISTSWTNNNCESVNNVLKTAVNWKKMQLHLLTEELRGIIISQERDVVRALHGSGNFCLTPATKHYEVSPNDWNGMPTAARERRVLDFIKHRRKKRHFVQSTDGRLDVMTSPSGGRKPGDVKQKKCETTVTFSMKSNNC